MQWSLISAWSKRPDTVESLVVGGKETRLLLAHNRRARRYVLRLRPDGSARVTIPRGGSALEARKFVDRNRLWLERQFQRLANRQTAPKQLTVGSEVLFRGVPHQLQAPDPAQHGTIRFGSEVVPIQDATADLRPAVQQHLWRLAAKELPPRVLHFAALHEFPVRRVSVRNQKSRWGSCSRRGTVSLNWRLIQAPEFVRDYIILHELCHLQEMNHSARFWSEVERVCPDFATAEKWLKQHASLLR